MTLMDLCHLARHYWKIVVATVLICTLAGGALGVMKAGMGGKEYSAEAVLTVTEPTATIAAGELIPLVDAIAANVVATFDESYSITQKSDVNTRSITFTAVTPTEGESIEIANLAAATTAEAAKEQMDELAESYREASVGESGGGSEAKVLGSVEKNRAAGYETVVFTMNDASQAISNSGRNTIAKYAIVGLLGGLFLAACVLVVFNLAKEPVKNSGDIRKSFDIPIILEPDAKDPGVRLWANVQFATEQVPRSICLIPAGSGSVENIALLVSAAATASSGWKPTEDARGDSAVAVTYCNSLEEDVEAAYAAHDADAVVLCVRRWQDSLKQVDSSLRELKLAKANLAGIALS